MGPQQCSGYHSTGRSRVGSWAASTHLLTGGASKGKGMGVYLLTSQSPTHCAGIREQAGVWPRKGGKQPGPTQGHSPKPISLQTALLMEKATSQLLALELSLKLVESEGLQGWLRRQECCSAHSQGWNVRKGTIRFPHLPDKFT